MSVQTYNTVAEWVVFLFMLDMAFCVLVLIAFGAFKRTRGYAGGAVVIASWIAGAIVWSGCAMVTYAIWGLAALIVGIVLAGIGVVPMALIASALARDWSDFWALGAMTALAWGVRLVGAFLVVKSEDA